MTSKIDPRAIVRDHLGTLTNYDADSTSWWDRSVFFGAPLVLSIVLPALGIFLEERFVSAIATVLSVFAALLLNLLLIIYDVSLRTPDGAKDPDASWKTMVKRDLLTDVHKNISFSILVAVAALVLLMGSFLSLPETPYAQEIWNGSLYFLIVLFVLTVLMVLKRVHNLLAEEVGS